MTVLTTQTDIKYDGLVGQDHFAYPFRVDSKEYMNVVIDDVALLQSEFSMTGLGLAHGGTVVLNTPLAADAKLELYRSVPFTQEVDYQPFDAFPAETHEGALDKLTMMVQDALNPIRLAEVLHSAPNSNPYTDADEALVQRLKDPANIKADYESNPNTNEFNDAEKAKLATVEDGATADQTPQEIRDDYESNSGVERFTTTEQAKLAGIHEHAAPNMSGAQIATVYEAHDDVNRFTDADRLKLTGIDDNAAELTITLQMIRHQLRSVQRFTQQPTQTSSLTVRRRSLLRLSVLTLRAHSHH